MATASCPKKLFQLLSTSKRNSGYNVVKSCPSCRQNKISFAYRTFVHSSLRIEVVQNHRGMDGVCIHSPGQTKEEFSRTLCNRCKRALVSTSANISGEPAPKSFAGISPEIIRAVDYVCTSRRDEKGNGKPSSIIKLTATSEIKIIRP